MSSRGSRAAGTDGSDYNYREKVEDYYRVMATSRKGFVQWIKITAGYYLLAVIYLLVSTQTDQSAKWTSLDPQHGLIAMGVGMLISVMGYHFLFQKSRLMLLVYVVLTVLQALSTLYRGVISHILMPYATTDGFHPSAWMGAVAINLFGTVCLSMTAFNAVTFRQALVDQDAARKMKQ